MPRLRQQMHRQIWGQPQVVPRPALHHLIFHGYKGICRGLQQRQQLSHPLPLQHQFPKPGDPSQITPQTVVQLYGTPAAEHLQHMRTLISQRQPYRVDGHGRCQFHPHRHIQQKQPGDFLRVVDGRLNRKQRAHGMGHKDHFFMPPGHLRHRGLNLSLPFFHGSACKIRHTAAMAIQQDIVHGPAFRDHRQQILKMIRCTHDTVDHHHRKPAAGNVTGISLVCHHLAPLRLFLYYITVKHICQHFAHIFPDQLLHFHMV